MPRLGLSSLGLDAVRLSAVCVLAAMTSGCAYVEVTHTNGTVSRSLAPLAFAQTGSGDNQDSAITATGLGLAVLNGTTTLGWFNASTVALDPNCRVVLIGNSDEQLRKFAELTGGARQVCSAKAFGG